MIYIFLNNHIIRPVTIPFVAEAEQLLIVLYFVPRLDRPVREAVAGGVRAAPARLPGRDVWHGHRSAPVLPVRRVQVPGGGLAVPQGGAE